MENPNNQSKLKAIIGVLAVSLLISLFFVYKKSSDITALEKNVATVSSEKENVLKDLEAMKAKYDSAIAENTSMSEELTAERAKVEKLIADLKASKGDVASLQKYKREYKAMEQKMQTLMQEVETLKAQNQVLTKDLDSTKVVLEDSKKYNEVLVGQNEDLVQKGSKLIVTNLKTVSYKERSSGKLVETDKASRIDKLKISFTIAENSIAKSGDKTYYVQVIDSKNNVLGQKETVTFGETSLTYSFTTVVKFANKTVEVSEYLAGKDFAKGTYFVNVFDKGELVSKNSFSLR